MPRTDTAEPGHLLAQLQTDVQKLIDAGKCKQAVEVAKNQHKKLACPESEAVLVDAYVARIRQFNEKGAAEDARTLVNLVRQRFPTHAHRLDGQRARAAALTNRLDELVAPLVRADLAPEVRDHIHDVIRRDVVDLRALAACPALPADHDLRVAAAAAWEALQLVTARPVSDEQIALPQVSRRSPLMGWKLLVRAIAAFYRQDDPACRAALDAIPDDAAAARIKPVLLGVIAGRRPGGSAPAALFERLMRSSASRIQQVLIKLRNAVEHGRYIEGVQAAIIDAMRACQQERPDLLPELRRRTLYLCARNSVPFEHLPPGLSDDPDPAYFLFQARHMEGWGAIENWACFLLLSVKSGRFASDSLEAGLVYLKAARLLAGLDMLGGALLGPRVLAEVRRSMSRLCSGRLMDLATPLTGAASSYQAAAVRLKDARVFQEWLQYSRGLDKKGMAAERAVQAWHKAIPEDVRALVELAGLAEKRKALTTALRHLAVAEALDPMHPDVRAARRRVVVANYWRHLFNNRPHLAAADIRQLEAVQGMTEGPMAGMLALMRCVVHVFEGDASQAGSTGRQAVDLLGADVAGSVLLSLRWRLPQGSGRIGALRQRGPWPDLPQVIPATAQERIAAIGRCVRLCSELDTKLILPREVADRIISDLGDPAASHSLDNLLLIGELAARNGYPQWLWAVSGSAVKRASGAMLGRFLLFRARAAHRQASRRTTQCLLAARELARQANDAALLQELAEFAESLYRWETIMYRTVDVPADMLKQVLIAERSAVAVPGSADEADRAVVLVPTGQMGNGPMQCDFTEMADEDHEEDDDGLDDDEIDDGLGLFEELLDDDAASETGIDRTMAEAVAAIGADMGIDQQVLEAFVEATSAPHCTVEDLLQFAPGDPEGARDLYDALQDLQRHFADQKPHQRGES